jgi:cytochrome c
MAKMLMCLFAFTLLAGCLSHEQERFETRGQALVETSCASCHAVGTSGDSPLPQAPQFRFLSQHYSVTDLEEALAEGIAAGHPAMPHFVFSSDDAQAIVTYLQMIQDSPDQRAP